jgi:EAL domain-containing protein (putative c-di-GMP-specific phosphodiesterase class I)
MPVKRLLIVDDDPRVCRMVERIAERSSLETFALDQADHFETTYEYFHPDAILLDLCMEQTDGVELLRFLSAKRSSAEIVLMSGVEEGLLTTTTELGRSMGLNMRAPLRKPMDKDVIRARLTEIASPSNGQSVLNGDSVSSLHATGSNESITTKRLSSAIQGNELMIHYQPVVDLHSNQVVSAEAIARWHHPKEGLITSERFISMADDCGLSKALTSKILVSAVESAAGWQSELPDISVSVNISPQLLKDLHLPDQIFELLRLYGLSPERLVLEVTDGHPSGDLTTVIDVLTRLRLKGIRLAYDNFGAHSSLLEQAHRLPYDIIKLDRGLVSDVTQSSKTIADARSIIERAGTMNCELVAVGIENEATQRRLAGLGCRMGQGFQIAAPMSAERFVRWAQKWEQGSTSRKTISSSDDPHPEPTHHESLPAGYLLHWYEIESILGSGGFGITYLARDTNLNRHVAIKEYFPIDMAARKSDSRVNPFSDHASENFSAGLERFITEARTLARFKHPNIVRVYSVFEANGTAYMVMDYQRGQSLSRAVRSRAIKGEQELLALVRPLLDGLISMHDAGFIHRDIKPDNIFLREDGVPVLLDFGAARRAVGLGTQHLTMMLTPNFAPIEQYDAGGRSENQGPWTDIYSIAATLYRIIVGTGPADAVARAKALLENEKDAYVSIKDAKSTGYSEEFLSAIDHALAFRASERPQSIIEWLEQFPEDSTSAGEEVPEPSAVLADSPSGMDVDGSPGDFKKISDPEEKTMSVVSPKNQTTRQINPLSTTPSPVGR